MRICTERRVNVFPDIYHQQVYQWQVKQNLVGRRSFFEIFFLYDMRTWCTAGTPIKSQLRWSLLNLYFVWFSLPVKSCSLIQYNRFLLDICMCRASGTAMTPRRGGLFPSRRCLLISTIHCCHFPLMSVSLFCVVLCMSTVLFCSCRLKCTGRFFGCLFLYIVLFCCFLLRYIGLFCTFLWMFTF